MYCTRQGLEARSRSRPATSTTRCTVDDCNDCGEGLEGRVDRVRSEIFIEGDFDDDQRARLTDIAQRCPVHRTVAEGATFTTETVFVG